MSKVKQIINIGNKEKLSTHVETIFKRYSQPGLHICDLATRVSSSMFSFLIMF